MHKIMQLLQSDHEIVIYFSNELTELWFIAFIVLFGQDKTAPYIFQSISFLFCLKSIRKGF